MLEKSKTPKTALFVTTQQYAKADSAYRFTSRAAQLTAHRDSTIRLIYYSKSVVPNFQCIINKIREGFRSVGMPAPFLETSRMDALAQISAFENKVGVDLPGSPIAFSPINRWIETQFGHYPLNTDLARLYQSAHDLPFLLTVLPFLDANNNSRQKPLIAMPSPHSTQTQKTAIVKTEPQTKLVSTSSRAAGFDEAASHRKPALPLANSILPEGHWNSLPSLSDVVRRAVKSLSGKMKPRSQTLTTQSNGDSSRLQPSKSNDSATVGRVVMKSGTIYPVD